MKGDRLQIWNKVTYGEHQRTCPLRSDPEEYGQKSYIMVQIIGKWDIEALGADLAIGAVVTGKLAAYNTKVNPYAA